MTNVKINLKTKIYIRHFQYNLQENIMAHIILHDIIRRHFVRAIARYIQQIYHARTLLWHYHRWWLVTCWSKFCWNNLHCFRMWFCERFMISTSIWTSIIIINFHCSNRPSFIFIWSNVFIRAIKRSPRFSIIFFRFLFASFTLLLGFLWNIIYLVLITYYDQLWK